MISFPPCKINLGLNILRKRKDGYHDIETCFYPVPFTDVLEIVPSEKFSFTSTGIVIPGPGSDNLCVKAYEILRDKFRLKPVKIHLHKVIPAGAGLGGGSSNGAHTLRLINEIFQLGLGNSGLAEYAAALGSDCPFFVYDTPMIGKGRGGELSPVAVPLNSYYFVLVNPGVHVSTAEAYSDVTPSIPAIQIEKILTIPVVNWKEYLKNDFEKSVFNKYPMIQEAKAMLDDSGALFSAMSGSGSSVFGIFTSEVPLTEEISKQLLWKGFL